MITQRNEGTHVECVCQRREMGPIEFFGKIKKSRSPWYEKGKVCKEFLKHSGNEDGHGRWRCGMVQGCGSS